GLRAGAGRTQPRLARSADPASGVRIQLRGSRRGHGPALRRCRQDAGASGPGRAERATGAGSGSPVMAELDSDWIDRLLEGEMPDWQALEQRLGPGSPVLARMRRTARLCSALARGHQSTQGVAEPPPAPAERWGHLLLDGQIGSGSSGAVYRAFDTLLEREV